MLPKPLSGFRGGVTGKVRGTVIEEMGKGKEDEMCKRREPSHSNNRFTAEVGTIS